MSFSSILQKFMNEMKLNAKDIAQQIGDTSDQTVYNWANGKTYPPLDKAEKLADLFQISLDDLADRAPSTEQPAETVQLCDLSLRGTISAEPFEPEEEVNRGTRSIAVNKLGRARPENCYFLQVSGRSMDQLFHDGEYIVVEKTNACQNGDIVIAYDPNLDGFTVKTFIRQDNIVILQPANPDYKPIIYNKPSQQKLEIIGVVICSERDF